MSSSSLRFTPSLESLSERLTPSIWVPTTEQTRQITIIQDLAPPDLNPDVSAVQATIPSVTDLVSDPFNSHAADAGMVTGRITAVAVDPAAENGIDRGGEYTWAYLLKRDRPASPATLEGHECLVFYAGGIPSSDEVPKYWVFGTELPPDANREIRHRLFAIVDRTQFDDDSEELRRSLVTTFSADLERPHSDTYYGTGVYKSMDAGRSW